MKTVVSGPVKKGESDNEPSRRYPFIHLGEERHRESKVSCPRTQHNVPGQGSRLEKSKLT